MGKKIIEEIFFYFLKTFFLWWYSKIENRKNQTEIVIYNRYETKKTPNLKIAGFLEKKYKQYNKN